MSLRSRLLVVFGVIIATYVVAALILVSIQRSLLVDQVDARLSALPPGSVDVLVAPPPIPEGEPPHQVDSVRTDAAFSDLFIGVARADGTVSTLLVGSVLPAVPDVEEAINATGNGKDFVTVTSTDSTARFRAMVVREPGSGNVVVAASSLKEVDHAVGRLVRTLWIAGGIIVVVLGIAFFWIQRLGLRPIARVTAIAESIAAGDRSKRVRMTDDRTEAGKLGHAFNVMLDERDAAEDRLRQFIADASHELRTPLTSVRGYLDLYQQGAFRKPEQLDDVVRRLSAEAARMYALVEDLLVLASLDEGRPLWVDRVDIGQLLREAAQDAGATQQGRQVEVITPDEGPVIDADESLLIQLVGILVTNALIHTPVTAPILLSVTRDVTDVSISVADRGPGLDPEAAELVFDRFWRGETSRSRGEHTTPHGSSGLGLAIARSITDSHGGTISLKTAPGEGCTFTIRLPTAHP